MKLLQPTLELEKKITSILEFGEFIENVNKSNRGFIDQIYLFDGVKYHVMVLYDLKPGRRTIYMCNVKELN